MLTTLENALCIVKTYALSNVFITAREVRILNSRDFTVVHKLATKSFYKPDVLEKRRYRDIIMFSLNCMHLSTPTMQSVFFLRELFFHRISLLTLRRFLIAKLVAHPGLPGQVNPVVAQIPHQVAGHNIGSHDQRHNSVHGQFGTFSAEEDSKFFHVF